MPEEIYYIFESPSESDIHINEYVTDAKDILKNV